MGKPVALHFGPADRPKYRHDGSALAYVMVDFIGERVLSGTDGFEDGPDGRFYLYASRYLAGPQTGPSPALQWTSSPSQDYFDFLVEVVHRIYDTANGPITVPPLQVNRGEAPAAGRRGREHLCPPQARKNFERWGGTQWPAVVIPHYPQQPQEIYLDGFLVQQIVIDFRSAELGMKYHKMVPGTFGDDDKTLLYAVEPVRFPRDVLWAFLHAPCSGGTFRAETENAVAAAMSYLYGVPLEKGYPPNRVLHHPEHLPATGRDDPDLPPTAPYRSVTRGGMPVRATPDGKSWGLPPTAPNREIPGTPEEIAADGM